MSETKIVVCDRGHVLVGVVDPHPSLAFHWLVSPGRAIRRWGTTEGLAQLSAGPREQTKLDALGTFEVPWRAVLFFIIAEEEKWREYLRPGAATTRGRR